MMVMEWSVSGVGEEEEEEAVVLAPPPVGDMAPPPRRGGGSMVFLSFVGFCVVWVWLVGGFVGLCVMLLCDHTILNFVCMMMKNEREGEQGVEVAFGGLGEDVSWCLVCVLLMHITAGKANPPPARQS